MSFISTAAHQKFISQCQDIISNSFENGEILIIDDKRERLNKDLKELQYLMDGYLHMLAEFPKLTCKYYNLHTQIRVNMRKLQLKQSRIIRRKLRSK